jgi:formylglycine-generating enzyme required for sulfatase activity
MMKDRLIACFALCCLLACQALLPCSAQAQASAGPKRIALVIGNDTYTHVRPLQKAGNDAIAMARELKAAGFEVLLHRDLNYRGMVKAVETLTNSITGGDQVVFFFAGHGVQIKSGNYLLPVDIEANSESEVEKTAYGLADLTDKLSDAKASFALIMVDACRDNPIKSNGRSIGATRGLSPIDPPKGQVVVFSASKGQQALDRLNDSDKDPNGVFTREFIKRMKKPGVRVEDMMREVQDSVEALARTVSHDQRPAMYSEARGNFYFFGPTTVRLQSPNNATATDPEYETWTAAGEANTIAAYQTYLDAYPKGKYAAAAHIKLSALTNPAPMRPPAPAPSNVPQPPGDGARASAQASLPPVTRPATVAPTSTLAKDCADCPDMVEIPAGSFDMGENGATHRVALRAFALSRTEVTQRQWKAVMGANPSEFTSCGEQCPVDNISWDDAQVFVRKLSLKTGQAYRLPSESEWEYACRANTRNEYCGSDYVDAVAWFGALTTPAGNSARTTNRVGLKQANAWGLYDMSGNVWEWTQDCWNDNYNGAPVDGSAWNSGHCGQHVLRGGSWQYSPQLTRAAVRIHYASTFRLNILGLRVARSSP